MGVCGFRHRRWGDHRGEWEEGEGEGEGGHPRTQVGPACKGLQWGGGALRSFLAGPQVGLLEVWVDLWVLVDPQV